MNEDTNRTALSDAQIEEAAERSSGGIAGGVWMFTTAELRAFARVLLTERGSAASACQTCAEHEAKWRRVVAEHHAAGHPKGMK